MFHVSNFKFQERGITIVEIIVIVAVILIAFVGVLQLEAFSIRSRDASRFEVQASFLAEEALEAIRTMRDDSWSGNIGPLSDGTTYYLIKSSSSWSLDTSDPGLLLEEFTRKIVFETAERDSDDNIVDSGTADEDTKIVTVTLEWNFKGDQRTLERKMILSNWASKL